jgi:murein L,D-transpeptidase YafK
VEGDEKTPLGRYPLSTAVPSSRFYFFLLVGYPTAEQRAQGYSGGAIGVHGPDTAFRWLGHATAWANWTQGCVALATRGQVAQVAKWVHDAGAAEIVLV